jgi:hypothetical protein
MEHNPLAGDCISSTNTSQRLLNLRLTITVSIHIRIVKIELQNFVKTIRIRSRQHCCLAATEAEWTTTD